jgi:AcrR family transcriptional regulator
MAELLDRRRPRRVDAGRNFDAILLAARESFTRAGIDASLEEIARQAGVGVATLYRNFPTRADLIETVYVAEVAAVCSFADELTDLDPLPALTAWITRFVAYLNTKRTLLDGLNRDSTTFRACREALYDTAAPLLTSAQAAGDVEADIEIDDLMRLVFALTGGIYTDDAQRARVLELSLRGIQTAQGRDAQSRSPSPE